MTKEKYLNYIDSLVCPVIQGKRITKQKNLFFEKGDEVERKLPAKGRRKKPWVGLPESLQFLNNATKFYNLMMMYRCAIREIQTKLEVLDDEFSVENNRNPISFIKTRIKKPNSIYNKLQKMGHDFTTENIQTYLNDVAGVRIVCAFIDDIYMISDLITQQDDIKVIEIKDYIKIQNQMVIKAQGRLLKYQYFC